MLGAADNKMLVDVHLFDNDLQSAHVAKRLSPDQVFGLIDSPDPQAANLLNLARIKPNPVPPCMDSISRLDILSTIRENDQAGKHEVEIIRDLSNGARFMLFATKYAVSLPHADEGGVITTATCEDGEKLCLLFMGANPAKSTITFPND